MSGRWAESGERRRGKNGGTWVGRGEKTSRLREREREEETDFLYNVRQWKLMSGKLSFGRRKDFLTFKNGANPLFCFLECPWLCE